jgi:hypothetical protein
MLRQARLFHGRVIWRSVMSMEDAAPAAAEVFVRLARSFSELEARVLHDVVERAPPGTVVDVDFRAVRECHDVALLRLSQDIANGRARFALHGLSHHQQRLLRYLGVPTAVASSGAGPN